MQCGSAVEWTEKYGIEPSPTAMKRWGFATFRLCFFVGLLLLGAHLVLRSLL